MERDHCSDLGWADKGQEMKTGPLSHHQFHHDRIQVFHFRDGDSKTLFDLSTQLLNDKHTEKCPLSYTKAKFYFHRIEFGIILPLISKR